MGTGCSKSGRSVVKQVDPTPVDPPPSHSTEDTSGSTLVSPPERWQDDSDKCLGQDSDMSEQGTVVDSSPSSCSTNGNHVVTLGGATSDSNLPSPRKDFAIPLDGDVVNLSVRTGSGAVVEISTRDSLKVQALKQRLAKNRCVRVPPACIRLVYKARILRDAETLAAYNIPAQAVIMMATVRDGAGQRFDPVKEEVVDEKEEEAKDGLGRRKTLISAASFRKVKPASREDLQQKISAMNSDSSLVGTTLNNEDNDED